MKLAICDDEKRVRDVIAESVREVSESIEIEFYSDARELLTPAFDADILFLDIQMPGIDGMKAARIMREDGKKTVIVFVTALAEQVFNAFDVGALNYIVKPFRKDRIRDVIKSAIEQAEENKYIEKTLTEKEEENESVRSITVKADGSNTRVILSEIAYAEIYDRRVSLHMNDRDDIEYYGRISELERITGKDFFRIHRAFLVNLGYVTAYDSRYVRVGDMDIPVARGKYREFVKAYLSYHTRRENL
ncbi:MAG: LytTR family DNA-binding domain-containing protein [Lachnospiraceae bacterium]|nr:LytTR family DNA-binding domain-containing protein [Lachnospiraceae bacterium]